MLLTGRSRFSPRGANQVPHSDDQPTSTAPTSSEAPDQVEPGTPPPPPPHSRSPVPLWPPPPPHPGYPLHRPGQPGHLNQNGHRSENGRGPQQPWPRHPVRQVPVAPLDSQGRPLASFFKRGLAIAVDFLVLSIALGEFGHIVFPLVVDSSSTTTAISAAAPVSQVWEFFGVIALVWIGYLAWCASSHRGQTLGMMLYGIAVRNDADGGRVTAARATLRSVILFALFGFLIDLLWPLWDYKRQSLHDKAARTVVVDMRMAQLAEQAREFGN